MYTRILSVILGTVLALSLAACGGTPSAVSQATPSESDTQAPSAPTAPAEVFEPIVLVDSEACAFKITAIDADNTWGYTLNAYLENRTDLELMFSLDGVSVNGFMCDPFWADTVAPGMKSNVEISFSSDDFERNGITDVTDISFTLNVYDNNDWTADHLVAEAFTIHPLGEAAAPPYVRTPVSGEIVLFDDENCAMIATGFDPDNVWGYTVAVYLENKTDKNLMFSIGDAAVNGFMCDPFWAETVSAGKRSNTTISWMEADFEDNGITDVESLTLPITVYDADDWSADYLIDETFTLNP